MKLVKLIIAIILIALPLNAVNAAVIGVTSPKANTVYTAGSTLYISYVFLDVDSVNIEVFSPFNGGTWEVVVDSLPTHEGTKIPIENLKAPDWAHYQIRITDLHHKADTAYSGAFTILNPPSPVLQLKVKEDSIMAGANINLTWDISPSVDSIAIETFDSWKKRWTSENHTFQTRDSALILNSGEGIMGGMHYYRIYDVNYPDKYSNTDSFFVSDHIFGGIDSLYPANESEEIHILPDTETDSFVFLIYFREFIELVPGKHIEINNDARGVVTTLSTNDTNKVKIVKDMNGDPTILSIQPPLPLEHSTRYYILSDKGIVKDMAGNSFNGFRDNLAWNFYTRTLNDFNGTLSYAGELTGNLVMGLYDQSDIENNITNHPENFQYNEDTDFPYNYSIGVPANGSYGIFCFLDLNNNFDADDGEPTGFTDNLNMNGKDSAGIDILLTDNAVYDNVFVLDQAKSYWGNNETFAYNAFLKSYFAGDWNSGSTPVVANAYKMDKLLWGVDFKLRENGSDNLGNSVLSPGTAVHLEFDFPDSLTINYIAGGALITGARMLKNRLILDLNVINPVASQSGNPDATLGFMISCSPDHTAGVNAYGSLFYGETYLKDISPVKNSSGSAVGIRINGKNGVENRLTGMLSDNFLIHNFGQLDPRQMPANSNNLLAYIPDLDASQYTVDNSFNVITKNFDTDGDGKLNKMYRVVVANKNWSPHDILFTYDITTGIDHSAMEQADIYYSKTTNTFNSTDVIRGITVYDISGKTVYHSDETGTTFRPSETPVKGVYLIRTADKTVRKVLIQ
ncbi:T9SS type A sorting domain-containing protein [Saccharicrinis sp. FJH54]|uniref:T9SS type A sorting domain-containing protein n=1 Tax=Saccharicrinis sp. FJH54 TaxID=3344665 RepID=UPI0035D50708